MALVSFKNFSFRYSCANNNVLNKINLDIFPGEFILFCGPSGSGKTTLLSNLKKEIRPKGEYNGKIYYDGTNIENIKDYKSACEIGFLFQNPDDQLVSDNVIQEIAFPLENMGLPTSEIRNRIAEMTAFFGIDKYLHKNVNELSGGQKQLVNLCSLLVLKPNLLLLDEPTSQLDPIASYNFLSMLRRLNEEFSITIMATEHKIDNIFHFLDKVVFIDNGEVKYMDSPQKISSKVVQDSLFSNYLPSVTKMHFLLQSEHNCLNEFEIPLKMREGKQELNFLDRKLKETYHRSLAQYKPGETKKPNKNFSLNESESNELMKCQNVWFAYMKENIILKDISLEIKKGEFISILGGNGTGKTTLLQILSGILTPKKGKINLNNGIKIDYVHQNPMIHFWQETVKEELSEPSLESLEDKLDYNTRFKKLIFKNNSKSIYNPKENQFIQKNELIEFFGLSHLLDNHPYDCSGGEKQKIAIAKALLNNPDILFLDEPTKGLDPISKISLARKLKKLQENGLAIVMTTHDIDFAAQYSERCIILFDGTIQIDSTPKSVFSSNNFYTTFVNRLVKNYLPECITLEDVKQEWVS